MSRGEGGIAYRPNTFDQDCSSRSHFSKTSTRSIAFLRLFIRQESLSTISEGQNRVGKQIDKHLEYLELNLSCALVADLHPCIPIRCRFYGICEAIDEKSAKCVCPKSCPSYEAPVCASNGKSYGNMCKYKKAICDEKGNFTIVHNGSCKGKKRAVLLTMNYYLCII